MTNVLIKFIKNFWLLIKGNIIRVMSKFQSNDNLRKEKAFIIIYIFNSKDKFDKFKPISLVNCRSLIDKKQSIFFS